MPSYQNQITRSVLFYRLCQSSKNDIQTQAVPGWSEAFALFFEDANEIVQIGQVKYQLHDLGTDQVVISMHKRIDLKFATQEKEDGGPFTDLDPDEQETQRLAKASVVVIGEEGGKLYAAITKGGDKGSPAVKPFTEFLNKALPAIPGYTWKSEGITQKSDREKLQASQGISMFEGSIVSHASAGEIEGLHYAKGIEKFAQSISHYVNTDVRVFVRVELLDQSKEAEAKNRDLALETNFDLSGQRKPKARLNMASGEELLKLAKHNFASEIYLDINDIVGAKFSALIQKSVENFRTNIRKALESYGP